MSGEARDRAHAHFESGAYRAALDAAREGLAQTPDDVELLVLAGRAAIELDADGAVDDLRRATELAPDDASAWHHLGEALAADGRTEEADAAFRRTVELDPEDTVALTHLGHTSVATGHRDEGVGYLARAAESGPGASTAAISLVEMYRSFGELDKALEQARQLARAMPDDALAALDVAELSLALGQVDDAAAEFERLRTIDDVPGHEAYPVHGLIAVEVARGDWDRVLALAGQAAAIDPQGLGTELGALALARTGASPVDENAPPPPSLEEADAALAASLDDYRRALSEARWLGVVEQSD